MSGIKTIKAKDQSQIKKENQPQKKENGPITKKENQPQKKENISINNIDNKNEEIKEEFKEVDISGSSSNINLDNE